MQYVDFNIGEIKIDIQYWPLSAWHPMKMKEDEVLITTLN